MEELITGLNILITYVPTNKRASMLSADNNVLVVASTVRKMTFQHVQLLGRLGWFQDGATTYDVTMPWSFKL